MKENWLFIKTADDYGKPKIIEFDKIRIKHFDVEKGNDHSLIKKANHWIENLEDTNHEFVNPNRVRFSRNGKIHTVLNENESLAEDCIFENDYEKLITTETELTESEIQNLKFEVNWNDEKIYVRFNEYTDTPILQKINEGLNREGSRIILEKFNSTLFLSFYRDTYHERLIPIKYVDTKKIILYGFPAEPYETECKIIE